MDHESVKGMRKNLCLMLLTAALILNISMAGIGTADPKPVISMDPKNNSAEPDTTFTVNIKVADVSEEKSIYGWEVEITFTPKIVKAVNATEGSFLLDTGYQTSWSINLSVPVIDNATGKITMGSMIMGPPFPSTGAHGNGILATVTFKAVSRGATPLKFAYTELDTLIWGGQAWIPKALNSKYDYSVEDGNFAFGAGGGVGGVTLELIAGVVIAVAVCSFAAFYYMRKRASAKA